DHDPVPNVIRPTVIDYRPIEILDAFFVQYRHVIADVRVLVDDGSSNDGAFSDPDIRNPVRAIVREVLFVFVEVRAHHHHVVERDIQADLAANADDGVEDPRAEQDRSLGNN